MRTKKHRPVKRAKPDERPDVQGGATAATRPDEHRIPTSESIEKMTPEERQRRYREAVKRVGAELAADGLTEQDVLKAIEATP